MLNRMRTDTRSSCSKADDSVLNHPEESSKWVWLPMTGDKVNISQLLIQIETAAQEMFQTETSKSAAAALDNNSVFKRIADDMIKGETEFVMESLMTNEENNANTAKADIKG